MCKFNHETNQPGFSLVDRGLGSLIISTLLQDSFSFNSLLRKIRSQKKKHPSFGRKKVIFSGDAEGAVDRR